MPSFDPLAVIEKIAVLFLILIIGYLIAKRGWLPHATTRSLSLVLVNVTQPCLILKSFDMDYSADKLRLGLILVGASLLIHTLLLFSGKLLFSREKNPDQNHVLRFAFLFSNCSFLGYPVLDAIFGEGIGVFYGTFYCIAFSLFQFSYGIALLRGGKDGKHSFFKNFLNPGIFATVLGVALYCLNARLPAFLADTFSMVGNMTFPLSMLIVGALLAGFSARELFGDRRLYLFSALKLVAVPLLAILVCKLFRLSGTLAFVCVIMCAVPCASSTAIFAESYDSDAPFAARIVGMTTLCSVLTLPAVVLLANAVL